jgi:DNA-binding XRE family transcriptional regulator
MKDIKKLRKICKLSQIELAYELGIEQSNYCNIENGKLIPNNLDEIKKKAIKILLPLLDLKILYLDSDLYDIKEFRKKIIQL